MILDILGGESAQSGADLPIVVGLAAAVPTALSGWADWARTEEKQQRVGLAHAAANITASRCSHRLCACAARGAAAAAGS